MASLNYKTLNIEQIVEWCKENNQVEWLKATAKKTYKTKAGVEYRITFIQLKKAFAEKFMPEIMPKAQPKKPTFYDVIEGL